MTRAVYWVLGGALLLAAPARAQFSERWEGRSSLEARVFARRPAHPGQFERHSLSLALEPTYVASWAHGKYNLSAAPFVRVDQRDSRRTHVDLRELVFQAGLGAFELRLGVAQVFWGVLESRHLVDVINQADNLEDIDGEDKLGQPLVSAAWVSEDYGIIEAYMMAGFRERQYPGDAGRLRLAIPVRPEDATYESPWKRAAPDFALRWSRSLGAFDLGLSYFHGTSREPQLVPASSGGTLVLVPHYDRIDQASLDWQVTLDALLLKAEALARFGQGHAFGAASVGFEYTTLVGDADLGLLAEYHHDDRDNAAPTFLQQDVFLGVRLALNDPAGTAARAGIIIDVESGTRLGSLEASRRWGENRRLVLQARAFAVENSEDVLYGFRKDEYVELEAEWYF